MESRNLCPYLNVVIIAFVTLMTLSGFVSTEDVIFTQAEEQPAGSFVGSIATTSNIINLVGESDRSSLQYSLLTAGYEHSDYFQIDRSSGNITFTRMLDREVICRFTDDCSITFSVAVRGDNNFFSTFLARVIITDVNDNSPRFPETEITIHISESANPSDFSTSLVTATDADQSSQYSINDYTIVPESPFFNVHFTRNLIGTPQVNLHLRQKLNREQEDVHTITIKAVDGGNPPRIGNLVVNVFVDDFNDNKPEFSQTFYTANFSENMGAGYKIIQVSADDIDFGDNGRVTYSLSNTPNTNIEVSGKIFVNSSTGQVILMESLSSGVYDILIDAHDNGTPRMSTQAVVKVNVLDTSNNKPIITVNAVQLGDLPLGLVSETEQPSTVVAVLNVVDPDSGKNGNVTCETSDTSFQLQQLQPGSFKLMVARALDREANATHDVFVTCRDQGTPSLNDTAMITIRLADENDNNPEFTKPVYVQNIIENNIAGDAVTFVNAFDIDEGDNALIEYQLEGEDGDFLITPDSGVIKSTRSFDREHKSRYEFKILAIDHGSPRRTGTAQMVVKIKDINDVSPTFTKEMYTFYLFENRDPHSIVGNITVTDPDEKQGGVVSLSLEPMHDEEVVPFEIDPQGRVSSMYTFDREVKPSYNFFVIGKDNGMKRLTSSAQIVVNILDVNDNKPRFGFPSDQNDSAFVNIPIKLDQIVSQIDVYDNDINKNSIVTYHIVNTNSSELFRIGKFSGEIISNRDLGPSDIGTYAITINATDQGLPVQWKIGTLNLMVQSESTKQSGVIADQNVLIVACIICFTVIVSCTVMVAMCILRRLDRQKKLRYAATHCPDGRPDNDDGGLGGHNQQYDMSNGNSKKEPSKGEKFSPYHQRPGHPPQFFTNTNAGTKRNDHNQSPQGFNPSHNQRQGDNNSSFQSDPPPFYLMGPTAKASRGPELNLHRHDDFQSTSSAETATGDSGHGSDEDLSNSLDQSNTPNLSMEPSGKPTNQHSVKGNNRRSCDSPIQSKLLSPDNRLPSGKPPPRNNNKGTSVRFDPRVTDIYEDKKDMPEFHAKLYFTSGNSHNNKPPGKSYPQNDTSSNLMKIHPQQPLRQSLPCTSKQDRRLHSNDAFSQSTLAQPFFQQQQHQQQQQQQHNQQQHHPHFQPHSNSMRLQNLPHHRRHHVSSPLSLSSAFNEDINDESDLNTTTSGSYSVASDDITRESTLMISNDMFV